MLINHHQLIYIKHIIKTLIRTYHFKTVKILVKGFISIFPKKSTYCLLKNCKAYSRGGQHTARGPDLARQANISGP